MACPFHVDSEPTSSICGIWDVLSSVFTARLTTSTWFPPDRHLGTARDQGCVSRGWRTIQPPMTSRPCLEGVRGTQVPQVWWAAREFGSGPAMFPKRQALEPNGVQLDKRNLGAKRVLVSHFIWLDPVEPNGYCPPPSSPGAIWGADTHMCGQTLRDKGFMSGQAVPSRPHGHHGVPP